MKILWIFLGGHHKIGLVWGSLLCVLGSFLRSMYRIGILFWVAKISNIFLGCLKFLIFLGWIVDAGSEPTYEEKIRVPPLGANPTRYMYGEHQHGDAIVHMRREYENHFGSLISWLILSAIPTSTLKPVLVTVRFCWNILTSRIPTATIITQS